MWIMVSGPYTSGASTDEDRLANLRAMNIAALDLFRCGHVPAIGMNMALPLIDSAGPGSFDALMMPISLALTERCDACFRVGGASAGADLEADAFRSAGKPVFTALAQIPSPTDAPSS